MSCRRNIAERWLAALLTAVLAAGCSTIDDDLSECQPPEPDCALNYELRLVTNINTELQTKLTTQTELTVASALRRHLSGIFTDYAHDVDLSFYDVQDDSLRLQHDQHIMDANQASYTLYLPMRHYKHLATANVLDNQQVALRNDERCHRAMLQQTAGDTIASHTTGLFTARQDMEVLSGVSQTFDVRLYMANCAAALVVDPRGIGVSSVRVFTTGFASQFNINDSTYTFAERPPMVQAPAVPVDGDAHWCYCSVTFPSRDPSRQQPAAATPRRAVIETTEPFLAQPGQETLWQFKAYVTLADGSTTETVLNLREPLRAGQLMIVKGFLTADGAVHTDDQKVGVSVTLDWNKGGNWDVPM